MSSLGMRIDDGKFEVGFTAATREEFDSYVERLQMVAATIWSLSPAAQQGRGIGDDEKKLPTTYQDMLHGRNQVRNYVEERKDESLLTKWREDHGLR